jgi:hypothetical protein
MKDQAENLRKLKKSSICATFVKKNNGEWNHQQWEELCAKIEAKYAPIDFDQVGLFLEEKKEAFLNPPAKKTPKKKVTKKAAKK